MRSAHFPSLHHMYGQANDALRLFRATPQAPVPFALEASMPALFDCAGDFFQVAAHGRVATSRFACVETYLLDRGAPALLEPFRRLAAGQEVDGAQARALEQLQLAERGRPRIPAMGAVLAGLAADLARLDLYLRANLGVAQFPFRFRRCDARVAEGRRSVAECDVHFQHGAEWSIANAGGYLVVAGDDWTLVSRRRWP